VKFRYGSELMRKELATFKSVMKSFMVLIVTALAMGETLAMAPDIIKGNQMVSSVFDILDRKTDVRIDTGEDIKRVEGLIELRGVEFRYPARPDVTVFKGLDLLMKAGRSMALVGMSGSGKSTVLSLVLRFYDPVAGRTLIDGTSLVQRQRLPFFQINSSAKPMYMDAICREGHQEAEAEVAEEAHRASPARAGAVRDDDLREHPVRQRRGHGGRGHRGGEAGERALVH
jgi:ATP-binding cassette subfamily B (MDR/TAP) protein 1